MRRDSGTRHDGGETWGDAKRGNLRLKGSMDVVPLHTTLLVFKGPVAPSVVTGPTYSRNGALSSPQPIQSIPLSLPQTPETPSPRVALFSPTEVECPVSKPFNLGISKVK